MRAGPRRNRDAKSTRRRRAHTTLPRRITHERTEAVAAAGRPAPRSTGSPHQGSQYGRGARTGPQGASKRAAQHGLRLF